MRESTGLSLNFDRGANEKKSVHDKISKVGAWE